MLSTIGLEVLVHSHANGLGLELMWCGVCLVRNLMIPLGLQEQLL